MRQLLGFECWLSAEGECSSTIVPRSLPGLKHKGPLVTTTLRTRIDRARIRSEAARMPRDASVAGWAANMEPLQVESAWSRHLAHVGVIASMTALLGYLTWRIGFTMPTDGWNRVAAWVLIAFEAFPYSA